MHARARARNVELRSPCFEIVSPGRDGTEMSERRNLPNVGSLATLQRTEIERLDLAFRLATSFSDARPFSRFQDSVWISERDGGAPHHGVSLACGCKHAASCCEAVVVSNR